MASAASAVTHVTISHSYLSLGFLTNLFRAHGCNWSPEKLYTYVSVEFISI